MRVRRAARPRRRSHARSHQEAHAHAPGGDSGPALATAARRTCCSSICTRSGASSQPRSSPQPAHAAPPRQSSIFSSNCALSRETSFRISSGSRGDLQALQRSAKAPSTSRPCWRRSAAT